MNHLNRRFHNCQMTCAKTVRAVVMKLDPLRGLLGSLPPTPEITSTAPSVPLEIEFEFGGKDVFKVGLNIFRPFWKVYSVHFNLLIACYQRL